MNKFSIFSNAKVNFTLDVISKQGELHELDTIIAPIDIKNEINIFVNDNIKDRIVINKIAKEGTNIEKALIMARNYVSIPFFDLYINTNILEGAGLGSSSADAAAILRFLHDNYNLKDEDAFYIGKKIGSDIPCMYINKPCRVYSTGDRVELMTNFPFPKKVIIVSNHLVFSTKDIFNEYDKLMDITCYTKRSIANEKLYCGNALEKSACSLSTSFTDDINFCKLNFSRAFMTGSGSAIIILDDVKEEDKKLLKLHFKYVKEAHLI